MNLTNLDSDTVGYIINGLWLLMKYWTEFNEYDEVDVNKISQSYMLLKRVYEKKIAEIDHEEELPETLAREPNKGEGTKLGSPNYIKTNAGASRG